MTGAEHPKEEVKSREYIKRFLELYRNSGISAAAYAGSDSIENNMMRSERSWSLFGWSLKGGHRESRELDIDNGKSPLDEFVFTVPRDPFLSPYLASDNLLKQLPPIALLVNSRI